MLSPCFVPCLGRFNPDIDLHTVDQFGFIDLRKAYESSSIPGDSSYLDTYFNGVLDPSDMLPRPKDNFERMRQAEYVKSVLKSAAAAEAKPSTGAPAPEATE